MYITWLGHSCFRLESAGYGLVIDPYRVVAGYPPLRVEANAVYISHHHFEPRLSGGGDAAARRGKSPFYGGDVLHLPRRLSGHPPGR